jgi:hypothetical protein
MQKKYHKKSKNKNALNPSISGTQHVLATHKKNVIASTFLYILRVYTNSKIFKKAQKSQQKIF